MKAHVFAPFGMGTTGYVWNEKMERLMARPHGEEGEPLKQNRATVEHVTRYGSAGELRTTPTDYAKFVIEVISPKPADAYRLRSDTLKEMLRPQIDLPVPYLGLFPSSWALGWQILHTDKGDLICHGGDNAGFHSMHVASVSRKSGFVVMTNGDNFYKLLNGNLKGLIASFV
jgi:CubicO group peptidase (beta-lactamase class C family)